jgi:hypothetical protein
MQDNETSSERKQNIVPPCLASMIFTLRRWHDCAGGSFNQLSGARIPMNESAKFAHRIGRIDKFSKDFGGFQLSVQSLHMHTGFSAV